MSMDMLVFFNCQEHSVGKELFFLDTKIVPAKNKVRSKVIIKRVMFRRIPIGCWFQTRFFKPKFCQCIKWPRPEFYLIVFAMSSQQTV